MKNQELGRLFYREILKINNSQAPNLSIKIEGLYRLLNLLFIEATKEEKLQFTTLFARIAFAGHKFNLNKQLQFYIHEFRRASGKIINKKSSDHPLEIVYQLGLKVISLCVSTIFKQGIPGEIAEILPANGFYTTSPVEVHTFYPFVRVVVLGIDEKEEQLLANDETKPGKEIKVQYNIASRNEIFNSSVHSIRDVFGFPVVVNLIDVEIDKAGIYRPKAFVIEPDYLVDVSAISECFKNNGVIPSFYFLKKFLPFETTKYLMIGNIANFFLDELMTNPNATFREVFPKVFRLNPLAFTIFENSIVKEIMHMSQKHFVNLKHMVLQGFQQQDVIPEHCFLEPSFYSEKYGIQGRLDVFYKNPDNEKEAAIIELKSGKTYMPNKWGISQNHYVQTMLYDLLVKSVYNNRFSPTNFILYSGLDINHLKFAAVTKSTQLEALALRNQLITIEQKLVQLNTPNGNNDIFSRTTSSAHPHIKGFLKNDLELFEKVYLEMSELERQYFMAFSGFIAREHQLARTGIQGIESINGLASLWLNDFREKEENFNIISHLEIVDLQTKEDDPILTFQKTNLTNPLANFRKGDIAVLYPIDDDEASVLSNQIFKCTIIDINKTEITIRLRSRQFNDRIFRSYKLWNLEHDMLDSGFNGMYRQLFQFAQFSIVKKDLLLTNIPPKKPGSVTPIKVSGMTEEQQDILSKIIAAKDYFLLWGPPGTGKTSVMLRHLVSYLLNETDENILLLAYTNRAVDEICESIERIDDFIKKEYLRIGSRFSTADRFKGQLLVNKLAEVNTRQELKNVIETHRIVVSTLASFAGKQELLQLKKFHRVIIDEASQILEPMLVGLLPHFEKFILIGDHKQLPAVVVQSTEESTVDNIDLKTIGLQNLRNSLFERLYKRCQENSWDWAFAQLSHQGRMHEQIMEFPNKHFYDGQLKILPVDLPQAEQQLESLNLKLPEAATTLEKQLCSNRVLFIPTLTDDKQGFKTNQHEAQLVGQLIQSFQRIYLVNGKPLHANSIGVITPYRAQIAKIKSVLQSQEELTDMITIDTVERYQGGARDIILISLCVNKLSQLTSLISESGEGVDRKLNVALTRARQHLVILGNPNILKENVIYEALIEDCLVSKI